MNYKNKIKKIILDSIDLSDYGQFDSFKNTYKIFLKEMDFFIRKDGIQTACLDWFQGLPTACTVPFYHHDIMTTIECSLQWAQEKYWSTVAKTFLEMAKPRLPTIGEIKEATKENSPYYLSRRKMQFFGQTMASFKVYRETWTDGKEHIIIFANGKHNTVSIREFTGDHLEIIDENLRGEQS